MVSSYWMLNLVSLESHALKLHDIDHRYNNCQPIGAGNAAFQAACYCNCVVQVKAEVAAAHRVQYAIGELIDLFSFAKTVTFCKIVSGNDCFGEVGAKVLKLMAHLVPLVVLITSNNIGGIMSR